MGRYLGSRRDEYILATKCGCIPGGGEHIWTRENMFRGLEQSLRRLKTDYVDVMQLHNATVEQCQAEGVVDTLQDMRAQGKVRWIGASTTLPHLPTYIQWGVFDVFQIPMPLYCASTRSGSASPPRPASAPSSAAASARVNRRRARQRRSLGFLRERRPRRPPRGRRVPHRLHAPLHPRAPRRPHHHCRHPQPGPPGRKRRHRPPRRPFPPTPTPKPNAASPPPASHQHPQTKRPAADRVPALLLTQA